jgi:hypothetical protein
MRPQDRKKRKQEIARAKRRTGDALRKVKGSWPFDHAGDEAWATWEREMRAYGKIVRYRPADDACARRSLTGRQK